MGYCENIREMIGKSPLIVVRPSVAILIIKVKYY